MSTPLSVCRSERATPTGRALLALLRERADGLRRRLVTAAPDEVPRLQGAVLALETLAKDIETEPVARDVRDGAYA